MDSNAILLTSIIVMRRCCLARVSSLTLTDLTRIRYGHKEPTVGPEGQPRWKYTYNGVSYVTDETSRHEITSWKSEDNRSAFGPTNYGGLVGCSVHVVLVVDHSGSMRKSDVPG